MLRTEVTRRVPEALKDEGGPWKLLAWLEQIPAAAVGVRQKLPVLRLTPAAAEPA